MGKAVGFHVLVRVARCKAAFTLLELVMVLAVVAVVVAGFGMRSGGDGARRRVACDRVIRLLESARREAVVRGCPVLVGLRPTSGAEVGEAAVKLGLFRVEQWPVGLEGLCKVKALGRWELMDRGVMFGVGCLEGLDNPIEERALELQEEGFGGSVFFVNALVFDAGGRLVHPQGEGPVALRLVAARKDVEHSCWVPVGQDGSDDWIRLSRRAGGPVCITR